MSQTTFRIVPRLDTLEDRNCPSTVTAAFTDGAAAAFGASISRQIADAQARDITVGHATGDIAGNSADTSATLHADAAASAIASASAAADAAAHAGVSAAATVGEGSPTHTIDVTRDASVNVSRNVGASANAIANVFASSDTHVSSSELGATGFSIARAFGTGNVGATV